MKLKHLICFMIMVAFSCLIPSGVSNAATYTLKQKLGMSHTFEYQGHMVSVVDSKIEGLQQISSFEEGFGCLRDCTWYFDGTNYFQLVLIDGQFRVINICHTLNQNDYSYSTEEWKSHSDESSSVGDITLLLSSEDKTKMYNCQIVSNWSELKELSSSVVGSLEVGQYDNDFDTEKDYVVCEKYKLASLGASHLTEEGEVFKYEDGSYWYLVQTSYKGSAGKWVFARCIITSSTYFGELNSRLTNVRGDATKLYINDETILAVSYEEANWHCVFKDNDGIRQVIIPEETPMFLFGGSMDGYDMTVMDNSRYALLNNGIAGLPFKELGEGELDSIVYLCKNHVSIDYAKDRESSSISYRNRFKPFLRIRKHGNLFINGYTPVDLVNVNDYDRPHRDYKLFQTGIHAMYKLTIGLGIGEEVVIPYFKVFPNHMSVTADGNRLVFRYSSNYQSTNEIYTIIEAHPTDGYKLQEWCLSKDLAADSALTGEKDLTALSYEIYPWFVLDTEVEIDNIRYHIENKTRNSMSGTGASSTVIAPDNSVYTGDIEIPTSVMFNDETVAVGSIDNDAFKNSTITSITLPKTISYVEDGTFTNIPSLKKVYVDSPVMRLAGAFDKSIDLYTYYTYNAYKYYKQDGYEGVARAYSNVIKFNGNGGDIDESDLSQFVARQDGEYVYFLKSFYTLPIPVKEGSVFIGWFDNPECEGTPLRHISTQTQYTLQDNCLPLYAKWQVVSSPVESESVPEIDYEDLDKQNQTDIEKEAEAQQKAEENAKQELSETEARALADKQAQQKQSADAKKAQEQAKADASSQNESLEAYTSPVVKIRSVKSKARKITAKFSCPVKVNGYEIQASTSAKFKKKQTKKITTISKAGTFKKMKKGKKYYVRVRAYVLDNDGQKVYGEWSDVKKVTVK